MRSTGCFAILAIVVLAAMSVPGRAAADAPRWTTGDFWEYDLETVVEAGLILTFNGTVRATVSDLGTRTVKGVSVTAYTTILTGGGSVRDSTGAIDGQWSYAGEQWVEAEGFKILRSVLQIDANGTAPPFGFSFQVQNTTEHEVLSDTWRYPIDVGTTGALVTNTTSTEHLRVRYGLIQQDSVVTATYLRTISLAVAGAPEVSAKAGTFSALEVHVGWPGGDVDTWFYAPSVGNNARTESYDGTGARIGASSLRSFRYQAVEASPFGVSPAIAAGVIGAAVASAVVAFLVLLRRRRKSRDGADVDLPRPPGPT